MLERIDYILDRKAASNGDRPNGTVPSLRTLRTMSSSTALHEIVSNLELNLAAAEKEKPGQAEAIRRALDVARRDVDWALERDRLELDRPPGCWCLGLGGKDETYTPNGVEGFREYCVCPEAQAIKEREIRALRDWRAEHRAKLIEHYFGGAQVPEEFVGQDWETYPVSDASARGYREIRAWAGRPPNPAQPRRGLFVYGPVGSGKSSLAILALRDAIAWEPQASLYISVPKLLARVRRSYDRAAGAPTDDVVDTAATVPLLCLDDLGAENLTGWVQETLFLIINERYEHRRLTIITSNGGIKELAARLGERIASRVDYMSLVVPLLGPDLRKRNRQ